MKAELQQTILYFMLRSQAGFRCIKTGKTKFTL